MLLYVDLMSSACRERGVEVWAYCLMPNHVHLIVVPESEDGLRRAIGDAHRLEEPRGAAKLNMVSPELA